MGMTTRSQRVGLNPQLPNPPTRRTSPTPEAANPTISPEYPNVEDFSLAEDDSHDEDDSHVEDDSHDEEDYFLVSITYDYSTITARARSFKGIVLAGATPLQLAQNGFYYRPSGVSNVACCFACQSTKHLSTFQCTPFEEVQQLHEEDCIWQIISCDLKHHLGTHNKPPPQPPHSPPLNGQLLPPIPVHKLQTTPTQSLNNLQQPNLPSLIKRYRPSLPRPKTNKQPMLPSSSDLSHPYRNRLLQCKNLFFTPTPYSQLKIFTSVFTINRHRSSSRIRQANAQSNELGKNPHLSHNHCPDS
ncbi:hypothetical protein N7522_001763 [Penicillium canescens]|nr:hypothetical protein N7522_001763 [Penicillium canescens]